MQWESTTETPIISEYYSENSRYAVMLIRISRILRYHGQCNEQSKFLMFGTMFGNSHLSG